jgi:hypothetical protein
MAENDLEKNDVLPWYAALILIRPGRIAKNLERIKESKMVGITPVRWQIFLGVLRMLNRVLFHSKSIGTSKTFPIRDNWRARLFQYRFLRGPLLFWEGSVVPLDLSGLASSPERLITHLIGTHHDGDAFYYDLRLLSVHPGMLEELRRRTLEILELDNRRSPWVKDLCVYEQYHQELLAAVERALAGDWSVEPGLDVVDTSLEGYLDWCASRPSTPKETWKAWRNGTLGLNEPAKEPSAESKEKSVTQ